MNSKRLSYKKLFAIIFLMFLTLITTMGILDSCGCVRASSDGFIKKPKFSFILQGKPIIVKKFNHSGYDYYKGHRGVDLRAYAGNKIYSPYNCVVSFYGFVVKTSVLTLNCYGYKVSIETIDTKLHIGSFVKKGQEIGTVNSKFVRGENVIYWSVLYLGKYINPISLIKSCAILLA